ncbi:hypothetical protein [Aquabacter sp. CN5-332]|uniref:hypothetical protein n=1 Tax=Aquabacter sp. CN5-332 TaxID=3156608 RepID=UPI0032B3AF82
MASTALAQDFPNTLNMTCAEAIAAVNASGSAVLATGPNVFNRYVQDVGLCTGAQVAQPQWVQTRDQQQCAIGSTCVDPSTEGTGR